MLLPAANHRDILAIGSGHHSKALVQDLAWVPPGKVGFALINTVISTISPFRQPPKSLQVFVQALEGQQ